MTTTAEETPLLNGGQTAQKITRGMDANVRAGFVGKVFGIVGMQLAVTSVIAALIYAQGPMFAKENMWLTVLANVAMIAVLCVMCCKPHLMREHPANQAILWGLTLAMSLVVGMVTSLYTAESVLLAFGITSAIVISMGAVAKFGGKDFTGMGGYLLGALIALISWGFMIMIFQACGIAQPWMVWLYSGIGVLLFSMFLVYDIQLVLGGGKHSYSVDDYVFAALNIYLDIINIFLEILRLFGERR